jgi:hypothetical protein
MTDKKITRAARRVVIGRSKRFFTMLLTELHEGVDEIWKKVEVRRLSVEQPMQSLTAGDRRPLEHSSD